MSLDRTVISAEGAPAAAGAYSHGIVSGGLLWCSGQTGTDPATGQLVNDVPADQARQALTNLQAVCAAAGTELANAVRLTIYLEDMDEFRAVNEVYASFFGEGPPARVTVAAADLPVGAQVEIDAIVAVP